MSSATLAGKSVDKVTSWSHASVTVQNEQHIGKTCYLLFFVCNDVTFRSPIDRIITPSFARQPDIPKRAAGQLVGGNKEEGWMPLPRC